MNATARCCVWILTVALGMSTLFCGSCRQSTSAWASAVKANAPGSGHGPIGQNEAYKILDRKYVDNTLVFNVTMQDLGEAKEIAEALITLNKQETMVRVFFHDTDLSTGSMANAQWLYEWTKPKGLVLRFDLRLPSPKASGNQSSPEYTVLSRKRSLKKRMVADVLVPSLSPGTNPRRFDNN